MPSFVRVENCPDQNAAGRRKTALEADGWTVQVISGPKIVVTSEVSVTGNSVSLKDRTLWPEAKTVVIAVLNS